MLVQAVIKQMHEAGLDAGFVVELNMLEATMKRWARQGRPEGSPALDAAQKHLAAALRSQSAPQNCALHTQRCVSRGCSAGESSMPSQGDPPASQLLDRRQSRT